jgi:hypothetical protein
MLYYVPGNELVIGPYRIKSCIRSYAHQMFGLRSIAMEELLQIRKCKIISEALKDNVETKEEF